MTRPNTRNRVLAVERQSHKVGSLRFNLLLSAEFSKKLEVKMENNTISTKKIMSPCDVEALKKCLEENKGDYVKCQSQIEAFKSSCSVKKPSPSSDSHREIQS